MKFAIAFLLLVIAAGCASTKVNVDLDSCSERGKLDGIRVGQCVPAHNVK
jgi:hypothetical protein